MLYQLYMITIRAFASPLRNYLIHIPRKSQKRKFFLDLSRKIHQVVSYQEQKLMKRTYHFSQRTALSSHEALEFLSEFIIESLFTIAAVCGFYIFIQRLIQDKSHPLEPRISRCEKEIEQIKQYYDL